MRDDAALAIETLSRLFNEKKNLLEQIAGRLRLQISMIDAEDFSAVSEFMDENTHSMSFIDSLDYEISAASNRLALITGMKQKTLNIFLDENDEKETQALRSSKNECSAALNAASLLLDNFLNTAKTKAESYLKDSRELERIERIKKLL